MNLRGIEFLAENNLYYQLGHYASERSLILLEDVDTGVSKVKE